MKLHIPSPVFKDYELMSYLNYTKTWQIVNSRVAWYAFKN